MKAALAGWEASTKGVVYDLILLNVRTWVDGISLPNVCGRAGKSQALILMLGAPRAIKDHWIGCWGLMTIWLNPL
jgi:hypothetical protein